MKKLLLALALTLPLAAQLPPAPQGCGVCGCGDDNCAMGGCRNNISIAKRALVKLHMAKPPHCHRKMGAAKN